MKKKKQQSGLPALPEGESYEPNRGAPRIVCITCHPNIYLLNDEAVHRHDVLGHDIRIFPGVKKDK